MPICFALHHQKQHALSTLDPDKTRQVSESSHIDRSCLFELDLEYLQEQQQLLGGPNKALVKTYAYSWLCKGSCALQRVARYQEVAVGTDGSPFAPHCASHTCRTRASTLIRAELSLQAPVDDREGEGDAFGRRLGRILHREYPRVGGRQLRAVGEQRRHVAVRAQAQQNHIEHRQPCSRSTTVAGLPLCLTL